MLRVSGAEPGQSEIEIRRVVGGWQAVVYRAEVESHLRIMRPKYDDLLDALAYYNIQIEGEDVSTPSVKFASYEQGKAMFELHNPTNVKQTVHREVAGRTGQTVMRPSETIARGWKAKPGEMFVFTFAGAEILSHEITEPPTPASEPDLT